MLMAHKALSTPSSSLPPSTDFSWRTDQLIYHSGPEPGLQIGPSQHPPNLGTVGTCDGDKPTNPKQ